MKKKSLMILSLCVIAPLMHAQEVSNESNKMITEPASQQAPQAEDPQLESIKLNIKKALETIENKVVGERNQRIRDAVQKLQSIAQSEMASYSFYEKCLQENQKISNDNQQKKNSRIEDLVGGSDQKSNLKLAANLHVKYLLLSLEANEKGKLDDALVAAVLDYTNQLVASAKKMHTDAKKILKTTVSESPISKHLEIDGFLGGGAAGKNSQQGASGEAIILPPSGAQLSELFEKLVEYAASNNKTDLVISYVDRSVQAQKTYHEANLEKEAYEMWLRNEYPVLLWKRCEKLYSKGIKQAEMLQQMLQIIQSNPTHAEAKNWITFLKNIA